MESKNSVGYNSNNIFNKIINKKAHCYKIFENEHVIAILDAFPVCDGHSLLISKLNKQTIMEFSEQEAANYLRYIPKISNIVQKATNSSGINIVNNNGYYAGQRVFHIHCHIVPRSKNDNLKKRNLFNPLPSNRITVTKAKIILGKMKRVMTNSKL
eukprot:394626_1